jgi:CRP-like cAMP-binding protein
MDTLKEFLSKYPSKSFDKGETILLRGDVPDAVHVIESGYVKTYSIASNGDERMISVDSRFEDFPAGFAFGLTQKSEYFYEGFTKCIIRMVPRDEFMQYLEKDPGNMRERHVRVTTTLLAAMSRINALEQSRASDKVAHTLLYMASQFGTVLRPYSTRMKIAVTQQEIADSLGLTRETTSIELKKLEMLKLISHSRKSYILYIKRLRKYLEEEE